MAAVRESAHRRDIIGLKRHTCLRDGETRHRLKHLSVTDAQALQKKRLSYIPSLDGLRGVFCILIVINHWNSVAVLPIAPIGWEVLQIFFVLSGFLITRILVHERERHATFGSYVKSFYAKRSLRIFPLYFIYLFFWGAMRFIMGGSEFIQQNTQELAQNWMFYFTYTANLKSLFNVEALDTPFFAHLWSLSLEEQFYLIMPFLIFFLKGRVLRGALIFLIIVPTIIRVMAFPAMLNYHNNEFWAIILVYRNLIFQTDSFALGAALAVFNFDFIKRPRLWFWLLFATIVGLNIYHYPMFLENAGSILGHFNPDLANEEGNIYWYLSMLGHPELLPIDNAYAYMIPLVNLWCFFMVLSSIQDKPISRRFFENETLINIGKVTYGMYVYHFCVILIFALGVSKIMGKPLSSVNIWLQTPFLWFIL